MQATRGRDTNVLFVVTQHSHDDHQTGETARTARRSAADVLADVIRPPEVDPNRTALAQAETAAEEARATATHVDPLVTVIADLTAGRTQRWLDELAAAGHLPEHHRVALAADDARTTLDQLLRTVELAGHDPAPAPSPTPSPRHRWTGRRRWRRCCTSASARPTRPAHPAGRRLRRPAAPRTCPSRPATACTTLAAGGRRAARRAGRPARRRTRRSGRGRPSARSPTPTTTPTGGPAWEQRAGLGRLLPRAGRPRRPRRRARRRPARGLAEKARRLPRRPRRARPARRRRRRGTTCPKAGCAPAGPPGSASSTPRPATSPTSSTPPTTRSAAAREDATVWQARADAETDPLVRDELATAARAGPRAGRAARRAGRAAEYADDARAVFLIDTAVTRDRAERARVAAGLDAASTSTTPADRVTAQEWLDAHLADQQADEAHREITEDDIARDNGRADGTDDRTARAETARSDAGRGAADPTQQAEPAERRRVRPPDATTVAFERAQQVLREVAERQQAEQAAAAHAAELESEDEQLRTELARQAAYDTDTDTDSASDVDEDVDGDEMPHRER